MRTLLAISTLFILTSSPALASPQDVGRASTPSERYWATSDYSEFVTAAAPQNVPMKHSVVNPQAVGKAATHAEAYRATLDPSVLWIAPAPQAVIKTQKDPNSGFAFYDRGE